MVSPVEILTLLRARPRAHSLPRAFYTDASVFEADLDAVWRREWLFVAASCEVAAPGQYVTLDVGGSPIIVVRDQDGAVRAFHNTCRHRGSKLLDAACGVAKGLVCPYHRWTYRLDGSLAWAPHMPDGFDKGAHGLVPIHAAEVSGTVFVCLAGDAPDILPFADGIAAHLAPHALGRAKLACEERVVVGGNWKLVMENSRECYHCAAEHRTLMRTLLDQYDYNDPMGNELIRTFWARMDQAGLPSDVVEGAEWRANRLPFINGAVSTTEDGLPAVGRLLGDVRDNDVGSLRWVRYPSMFAHALGDYAVLVRMLPLSATTTEVCTKWLVNADAVEEVDYEPARLRHVWSVTNAEDALLVERNQAGVASMAYQPGPYAPVLESGVVKFVDWYCGRLARHLGAGRLTGVAA